ncbi:hypothetical protein PR202_ga26093 [Eleusine coracana subsp. coracana]|uniref:Alpha-taxilin n=1 Tax=Eleusine coracana subsp. coracana TaxID=191504 RepID=A0AAV5DBW4_ELECO|nr:hypothetical protein QOZ80_3AG0244090 [Eleusine coracana subsp. coracana]GJN08199.1 hypothetical protein PR202_ga26093 [Eleusine coracana subsp. coracana]
MEASGSRATEGSPATRLPEADSLPDGFVDSFAADQALPLSSSPVANDLPRTAVDSDRPAASVSDVGETLGAPSSRTSGVASGEILDASSAADALGTVALDASAEQDRAHEQQETTGDTADAKGSLKESSGSEPAESTAGQKETGELKRKVTKRSKLEKDRELLQLAQGYQQVLAERDAAIAVKEKLESLCREFQLQNKMLKDECRKVSTEGHNMRMELSEKFNNAIKDVSIKLEEQKNECIAQLEENNMLRNKLKDLADQYDITQQKYAHQLKEKMLELELADLKIQHHQEKAAKEHTQMQLYAEQVSQLITTEKNLRAQLAADGERFQQFQETLSKSNEVFETYKQEMEKMVKVIKTLKKENEFLKGKCENSDIALVKLIEERELTKKQMEKLKNQKEKLESLCRSLQAERKQGSSGSVRDVTSNEVEVAPASQGS